MPRWYVGLSDLKSDLGITSTDNDATLGRAIERASRWLEGATRRVFIPEYGARTFDAPDSARLWLYDDLDTVVSIVDAAGALAVSDYVLQPDNTLPKAIVELVGGRSWTFGTSRRQAITITGWWGYRTTLATVGALASALTSSATSLTLAGCQAGWMLKIGSELLHVSAVSGATVTVERGQNGTTAAAHDSAAAISRYVVDPTVADVTAMVAAAFYAARANPGIQSRSLGAAAISYGTNGAGAPPADAMSKAAFLKRHV